MEFDDEPPPEHDDEPRWESDFSDWPSTGADAPDAVGLVMEVADVIAVFAAERLVRVDRMRREALAHAERYGWTMTDVVARSIRLELACALRITEHAAGDLLGLAEAVVHRYPPVLESLSRARMTERHAEVLVSALDRCLGPGCGMPASRCHIDHNVAWEHGGSTALTNLAPFCEGHHIVKHHGGWIVRQLPGGAIEWTSPTGRRYTVHPERPVPAFRTTADNDAPF
ncbi:HNH endonuclease signature motif containing protein [Microbacterium pumilum]|uniref:HNH endonuclease signature motif containing protein n=1 Tax=Microbacterium pumilum TaxID=344165 RepID=UPI0031DF81A3